MSEEDSTFCKNTDHHNQTIRFLCLEEGCTNDRLICPFCVRDRHRKHSLANLERYIEPLARLGMNSHYPFRDKYSETLQNAINSIGQSWEKVNSLICSQSKFLQETILHQLQTISHTFSENLVESASLKMTSGIATHEEVEEYVRMINLLGNKHLNDPEKFMAILKVMEKNIEQILQEVHRKLNAIFTDFQTRVSKYSFSNPDIDDVLEPPRRKPDLKESSNVFQQLRRSVNGIKDQPSQVSHVTEVFQNHQDTGLKVETDESASSMMEVQIGMENVDGIGQMKSEGRLKVRKVVVTCCKNPQAQLTKILSLGNLQELQIYWFQLAKKEYLIRMISSLPNLKSLVLNCANEFDEECSRLLPKKLPKIRKLEYGWDFHGSLRDYDDNIYFRLSPYTNRGCPLKTSVTREMVVGLKKIENVWLGDFMYFRPSNNEIPFRNMREITIGQTNGKYFRIPEKLTVQLRDTRELLSLAILHVKIDEHKLFPILLNNPFLRTFVAEGCDDITDGSLRILAKNCNITHLALRENRFVEGVPIWEMGNLATLILVECARLKASDFLTGVKRLPYLSYLNLYGNKWVHDDLLSELPNPHAFHALNLGRTNITDRALPYLVPMRELKVLCLDCNRLSGPAIATLSRQLRSLEKLSLWGLDGGVDSGCIGDEDLEVLAEELALTHLSIRYCRQLSPATFLKFKALRFIETDRENLTPEVEFELEKRGVKLLLDLEKIVIEDQL